MHEKICFSEHFGSERVNESVKVPLSYFLSVLSQIESEKVKSVKSVILGLLANTLTANYEHSRSTIENLPLPFQMEISEKAKKFFEFFIAFSESALNFQHFEKRKSFIAQVFPRFLTPKDAFT